MATSLIKRIEQSLAKEGLKPRSRASREWLKSKVQELKPTPSGLMRDRERIRGRSIIGRMYYFFYDPKYKDSLPYYDRFPLVIPIEQYPDGFLGLNLHYIHPKQRIILLDKLSSVTSDNRYDEKTKFNLSYSFLAASSRAFEATPCIKRYLYTNIDSRFLEISANEWDIAALLPVESFVGASTSKVYADSRKKF